MDAVKDTHTFHIWNKCDNLVEMIMGIVRDMKKVIFEKGFLYLLPFFRITCQFTPV